MRFRIGAIECDRLAGQGFGRPIRFSLAVRLEYGGRLDISHSEALVAAGERRIDIDGILKAGSPIGVSELFDRYKKGDEESIWTLKEKEASGDTSKLTEQEKWLLKYS